MKLSIHLKKLSTICLFCICFVGFVSQIAAQDEPKIDVSLTADEVGNRILNLIKDVKKTKDLSPENIEKLTEIKVFFNGEGKSYYNYSGKVINSLWHFKLDSPAKNKTEKPNHLNVSFNHQSKANLNLNNACLDFEKYKIELTNSGFSANPYYDERNDIDWWNFSQESVTVQIWTKSQNIIDNPRMCVSKLTINLVGD
jgi:hypothetical protein